MRLSPLPLHMAAGTDSRAWLPPVPGDSPARADSGPGGAGPAGRRRPGPGPGGCGRCGTAVQQYSTALSPHQRINTASHQRTVPHVASAGSGPQAQGGMKWRCCAVAAACTLSFLLQPPYYNQVVFDLPQNPGAADEDEGGLPINRKLTRLVLTPGIGTPGGAAAAPRSPSQPGSEGGRRSPWRLVAESPAAQDRRGGSGTPLSAHRRSPLGAASPAAAGGGGDDAWRQLRGQLLQRCQADGGGIRVTTAKRRVTAPPSDEPSTQPQLAAAVPPPAPPPELPPVSPTPARGAPAADKPSSKPSSRLAPQWGAAAGAPVGQGGGGGSFSAPVTAAPAFGGFGGSAPAGSGGKGKPPHPVLALRCLCKPFCCRCCSLWLVHYFKRAAPPWPVTLVSTPSAHSVAPGAAAPAPHPSFIPAAAFEGAKPGYAFKMDGSGLGYYKDSPLPSAGSLLGSALGAPLPP
jgi:hypothetical protein